MTVITDVSYVVGISSLVVLAIVVVVSIWSKHTKIDSRIWVTSISLAVLCGIIHFFARKNIDVASNTRISYVA